jgi:hypothetical protein
MSSPVNGTSYVEEQDKSPARHVAGFCGLKFKNKCLKFPAHDMHWLFDLIAAFLTNLFVIYLYVCIKVSKTSKKCIKILINPNVNLLTEPAFSYYNIQ